MIIIPKRIGWNLKQNPETGKDFMKRKIPLGDFKVGTEIHPQQIPASGESRYKPEIGWVPNTQYYAN